MPTADNPPSGIMVHVGAILETRIGMLVEWGRCEVGERRMDGFTLGYTCVFFLWFDSCIVTLPPSLPFSFMYVLVVLLQMEGLII